MNSNTPALSFQSFTVKAYASLQMAFSGSQFFCKSASGPFKIAIDGKEELDFDQGYRVRLMDGKQFRFLVFHNATANDISISGYLGTEQMDYFITALAVTTTNAPTYTKGSGQKNTTGDTFNGLDGAKVRKQFIIANLDAANPLYVQDGAGTLMGLVVASSSWTVETGGTIKVSNPSGCNWVVCEIFYS